MTDIEERERYQLTDRYRLDAGRVFLSGSQALARLAVDQLRADRRAGLNTAAFISGYQGSPLAGLDRDLQAAIKAVPELPVVFQPGLNEELAATAVMGSQLAATLGDARYDGVVGLWYGKAPGLDRASDALRHAAFVGASQYGGAVALVGDDPAAKSSTLPSSSDASLVDLHMPVLFPGDAQEVVDLGRHAVALSRASGLWTSMKIVSAVADGSGTVDLARRADRSARAHRGDRRQAVRAPALGPPADALHAGHGARVPGGPARSRPPLRRRQRPQPHRRRLTGRMDRHRRLGLHLPRDAGGAGAPRPVDARTDP